MLVLSVSKNTVIPMKRFGPYIHGLLVDPFPSIKYLIKIYPMTKNIKVIVEELT